MKNLIETINKDGKELIDARLLWQKLESKQEFAHWVKAKVINNPYFTENEDYVLLDNIIKQTTRGGHNRKDYGLTIKTCKKVSMAEQTEVGNKYRDYFIELDSKKNLLQEYSDDPFIQLRINQINQSKRIDGVENKLNAIIKVQEDNIKELKKLPLATETAPEIALRDKIRMLVNKYAQSCGLGYSLVWRSLYENLYYKFRISIGAYKKLTDKESKLDIAERNDFLDKLHIVISDMLKQKNIA